MTSEATDVPDELVRAARAGDRNGVERLLAMVQPRVVRYCRARLGPPDQSSSADDVAQEVCLAVLRGLPGYRFEGRSFMAFVHGVAAHKVIDVHRASIRHRQSDDVPDVEDPAEGPEQHALRAELSGELRRLLDELPEAQREVIVLRVALGMSAAETAATVGSTPGAVRVAQHRGIARLRRGLLAISSAAAQTASCSARTARSCSASSCSN
jgi:RNA polymerase sigma-70 factor (ECF subfamily)